MTLIYPFSHVPRTPVSPATTSLDSDSHCYTREVKEGMHIQIHRENAVGDSEIEIHN